MRRRNELAHIVRHYCLQEILHVGMLEKELREYMSPSIRELFMDYAFKFVGKFYIWGGSDPSGFDCSGFCIEALKSVGALPRHGDWTAEGLWYHFKNKQVQDPHEGCLVFWADSAGKPIHIEICVNEQLALGASGGGSKTTTLEKAIEHDAFIKMRPMHTRAGIKGYVDPFSE